MTTWGQTFLPYSIHPFDSWPTFDHMPGLDSSCNNNPLDVVPTAFKLERTRTAPKVSKLH